eukprot:scaffold309409_cov14-Tisochrysis_lutea.AAC.1
MQWNASNKHDEHSADEFKESQDVEKGVPTVRLEQEQGKDGKEVRIYHHHHQQHRPIVIAVPQASAGQAF